jgi:hypothetical protein
VIKIYSQNTELRNLILKYQSILVCGISLLSFFAFKVEIEFLYGIALGTLVMAINIILTAYSTNRTLLLKDTRFFNSTTLVYFSRITIFGLAFCFALTIGSMAAFGMITTHIINFFALFLGVFTLKDKAN